MRVALQIRVNQQERQLTIAGERRRKPANGEGAQSDEDTEAAVRQQRRERRFGKFKRTLRLPETADSDAVSARCAPTQIPLLLFLALARRRLSVKMG